MLSKGEEILIEFSWVNAGCLDLSHLFNDEAAKW